MKSAPVIIMEPSLIITARQKIADLISLKSEIIQKLKHNNAVCSGRVVFGKGAIEK